MNVCARSGAKMRASIGMEWSPFCEKDHRNDRLRHYASFHFCHSVHHRCLLLLASVFRLSQTLNSTFLIMRDFNFSSAIASLSLQKFEFEFVRKAGRGRVKSCADPSLYHEEY